MVLFVGIGDRCECIRGVVRPVFVSLFRIGNKSFVHNNLRQATYVRFSAFRKLMVIRDRGLNADISKYGTFTWILPRGAYTLPSKSGPLTPIMSLAFCTISVYRCRSSCMCGSNLNWVSDSLSGVRKSKLNMSAYKWPANPAQSLCCKP